MRLYPTGVPAAYLLLALAAVGADPAQPLLPLSARVAAQNALFEEQYQSDLKLRPELATAFGDYRYNDQLNDYSLTGYARRNATDRDFLDRLQAIATEGFGDQDLLSHDLLVRTLQQRIADFGFKDYEMPVSQMSGPHVGLADLPLAMPFDSVKHYEDYIARLHQVPRVFTQTAEVLRAGMRDQLMPVRFLLDKVPAQCQGVMGADPFLIPTRKYPGAIAPADQARLTREIEEAVQKEVLPAYKTFATFIASEYAPHGRTTHSGDRAAERPGTVFERYPEPHYGERFDAPADPRARVARNRSDPGGDAGDRQGTGIHGSRLLPAIVAEQSQVQAGFGGADSG